MNKSLIFWLRWIGVLPVSLISGMLVTFPIHWVLYRTLSGGDNPFVTPYPELPERLLQPFFSGLVIVWVASLIAPSYKFKTSVIMLALWVFGAGGAFILGYLGYSIGKVQLDLTSGGLPIIMGVVGAIIGVIIVKVKLSQEY